jgi:VWFA-related protein
VKDRRGRPDQDLKQTDFTIYENGKPQRIVAFDHHAYTPQAVAAAAALPLPKGEYSNVNVGAASLPAINIILFDALNSDMADQMYGREQMVQFLKTLPPGQPTALFELGDVLKILAGFSTNSDQLREAAEKLMPHSSMSFVSEQEAEQRVALYNEMLPPGPIGGASGSRLQSGQAAAHDNLNLPPSRITRPTVPLTGNALASFIIKERSWGEGRRLKQTAVAFMSLARILAGYPGRKNILWLSEGFPLSFGPEGGSPDLLTAQASLMAGRLASEQVAVYPIDIRSLALGEPTASTPNEAVAGRGAVASLAAVMQERLILSQHMMERIARDTGGEAFYNTNDLKNAFQRAIEDGSNFYSLAYVPSDRNWNGPYRQIKVEVDRGGLDLAYRPGYYATERHPSPVQVEQEFDSVMRPGIPDSTMLPFTIAVTPPGSAPSVLTITYHIAAEHVAFQDSAGGRKWAQIKFVAVAYTKDGKPGGVASQTETLNLKPDTYNLILKSGVRFRQQLRPQPGDNDLRVGVLDENTGAFGTLDVPLPR